MAIHSEHSAKQIGNNMVVTHAYTPAAVRVGDMVRVTYGDKTIFTEVISVRPITFTSQNTWIIGVKGIQAALYVNENYHGAAYIGTPIQILKVRHTVTPIADYIDAVDTVSFAGLF